MFSPSVHCSLGKFSAVCWRNATTLNNNCDENAHRGLQEPRKKVMADEWLIWEEEETEKDEERQRTYHWKCCSSMEGVIHHVLPSTSVLLRTPALGPDQRFRIQGRRFEEAKQPKICNHVWNVCSILEKLIKTDSWLDRICGKVQAHSRTSAG